MNTIKMMMIEIMTKWNNNNNEDVVDDVIKL